MEIAVFKFAMQVAHGQVVVIKLQGSVQVFEIQLILTQLKIEIAQFNGAFRVHLLCRGFLFQQRNWTF